MILFYSLACLLVIEFQADVISSLPDPWRLFPLLLILGVIILHERSLLIGALWLTMGGVLFELRGLGTGLALASVVAAGTAIFLATGVFAKRSLFALVGVTAVTALTALCARLGYLLFLGLITTRHTYPLGQLLGQGITSLLFAVIGAIFIGTYVRRLTDWSRTWFVGRRDTYDPTSLT